MASRPAKVKRIVPRRRYIYQGRIDESLQYIHCTPLEAITFSKNGKALGYELLRWGEKHHKAGKDDGFIAAIGTAGGVQLLIRHPLEKSWIDGDPRDREAWRGRKSRAKVIELQNFFPWRTLSGLNKDYIFSLLWVPEEPVSALEALARAASD